MGLERDLRIKSKALVNKELNPESHRGENKDEVCCLPAKAHCSDYSYNFFERNRMESYFNQINKNNSTNLKSLKDNPVNAVFFFK